MTSSQSFGNAAHTASVNAQNLNHGSSETKSTVIVVLSPTVNGNQLYRAENNGQVVQAVAQGKVMNRVTDLLGMGGESTIMEMLGPRGSAAASIDERVKLKDSAAQILRYTVNGSVERLQKLLSEALFKVSEKAANDNTTLAAYAARFGVHAIVVSSEAASYDVVKEIVSQLESVERDETKFIPAAKANVDQINAPIINWAETSVNAILLDGAALSFVVRAEKSRVNFLINSIKGNNVSKALDVFKREDQSSVTMEEKVAALEAIEYDLAAMPDEEIAEAYAAERADFLEGAGDAVQAENSSEEEEEENEENEEESEDDSEPFNASETLAVILVQANLDRAGLKKLVFVAGGKVFASDTPESLTVKLLELVEDLEYDEFFNFILAGNEKLGGAEGLADWLHAESVEADEEEVEEDHDDESEEAEDEDSDEESEEETDEEEDDEEGAEFSAAAEFASLIEGGIDGGELERDVVRAVARSDFFQLKTFKSQTATDILESLLAALSESSDYNDPEAFEQLIHELAELPAVAEAYPSWADYEVNPVDYTELFQFEGGSLDHEQRIAALESVGVETDGLGMVAVLKAFETYRAENGFVAGDSESEDEDEDQDEENLSEDSESEDEDEDQDEDETEEEEADDETFALPAPVGDENFVAETTTNEIGTFLRVRQEQTLLVNFALTDRNTFEGIREELNDQSGVNYLVPFNRNEETEGAMYLPLTVATDLLANSAALPFMSDRKSFNVDAYAKGLGNTMESQLDALLYEGRLEAGQDPSQSGLVLGDFIDDDEDETDFGDDEDINADDFSDLTGDHIPMTSLYNAHVSVRPVVVGDESTVLNTVVLNIALPCVWGLNAKRTKELVQSAYNRVIAHVAESDIKVYVGFTLNSGSLVSDASLRNMIDAVSSMASDEVEVSSYSSNDVIRVNEADDLVEAAYSIGTENLPLILLSSGVADAAFANGGDLVLLLSEVEADETEE